MRVPVVSVLIPVFNVEKYLRECLDSVLKQTLADIEVVCVDDGSSDASLAILKDYEKRDPRVRVIALGENRGVGVARNACLNAARGRFVYFVDSDDLLCEDILQKLCDEAEASGCDIAICWGGAFPQAKDDPACCAQAEAMRGWLRKMKPVRAKRLDLAEIGRNEMSCSPCAKLYRRDFLERNVLRFVDRKAVHEDEGFRVKLIACRPLVSCIPEVGFLYRIRSDSIMGSRKFGSEWESLLWVLEDAIGFARHRLSPAEMQEARPQLNRLLWRMGFPFVVTREGYALARRIFVKQGFKRAKCRMLARLLRGKARVRYESKANDIQPLSPLVNYCCGTAGILALDRLDRVLLLASERFLGV